MWKFVVVLLLTAFAILVAQLVSDAPVIQTRVGAANAAQVIYAYAGIRGEGVGLLPHAEERPQGRVAKHELTLRDGAFRASSG